MLKPFQKKEDSNFSLRLDVKEKLIKSVEMGSAKKADDAVVEDNDDGIAPPSPYANNNDNALKKLNDDLVQINIKEEDGQVEDEEVGEEGVGLETPAEPISVEMIIDDDDDEEGIIILHSLRPISPSSCMHAAIAQ